MKNKNTQAVPLRDFKSMKNKSNKAPQTVFTGGFSPKTQVKMADNSLKNIEDVKPGEKVLSKQGAAKVLANIVVPSPEKRNWYHIQGLNNFHFSDNQIFMGVEFPYLAADPDRVPSVASAMLTTNLITSRQGEDKVPFRVEQVVLSELAENPNMCQLILDKEDWLIVGDKTNQFLTLSFASTACHTSLADKILKHLVSYKRINKSVIQALEEKSFDFLITNLETIASTNTDRYLLLRTLVTAQNLNSDAMLSQAVSGQVPVSLKLLQAYLTSKYADKIEGLSALGWRMVEETTPASENEILVSPSVYNLSLPQLAYSEVSNASIRILLSEKSLTTHQFRIINEAQFDIQPQASPNNVYALYKCFYLSTNVATEQFDRNPWRITFEISVGTKTLIGTYQIGGKPGQVNWHSLALRNENGKVEGHLQIDTRVIGVKTKEDEEKQENEFDLERQKMLEGNLIEFIIKETLSEVMPSSARELVDHSL
ncbi:hypothetical protein [Microscilla marina]|uniref:Uncharacterized protein n=1 Tax=Microscilla marina ATCC 23134 TaxID=313606 RepID=A1ZUM7_MICM2|nr:hypothetical protein [Microscilla marina]EAY25913.1 hypothetical protein M23134_00867 [Microscilla marina ATCC 23134]